MQFPEDIGFIHNDILDEWEKPVIDGKLLIWKNLNNVNFIEKMLSNI